MNKLNLIKKNRMPAKSKMCNRFIFLFLIIFSLYTLSFAEFHNNEKKVIGYNDYLTIIEKALPDIKINDMDVLSAENKIKSAKSNGDSYLNAGAIAKSNNDYTSYPDKGNVKGYNYSVGLSKTITSTGTKISTIYNFSKNSYSNYDTVNNYSTYEPSLTVKVNQPLLNNFLGKVDRYSENNAKMLLEVAKIRLQVNNKNILNIYKKLYFQWIMYNEIIKNLNEAIKNLNILKSQIKKKLDAGLADNDDYQNSIASILTYENHSIEYQTLHKNIETQLSLYIDFNDGIPDTAIFEAYTRYILDNELIEMQFKNTTSSKMLDLTMKNYIYSKGVYENRLLPEFNVFTEVVKKNLSESNSPTLKDTDYNVGFEFKYYLDNNSAESNLKDVEIQIKSLEYESLAIQDSYLKNIRRCIESVKGISNQLSKKEKKLNALKSQLVTEKLKYKQARLNLSYIIDTANNITFEKNTIIALRYQLIEYYLDYLDMIK